MAPATSEADIVLNRNNIALAKTQRLIASWLPPRSAEALPSAKSEEEIDREEIDREEQDMFMTGPEVLGMGAVVPKDDEVKREKLSSNDKLREQLLGRDYARKHADGKRKREDNEPHSKPLLIGSKPRPTPSKQQVEEDSEDDGGRSSLGKSKNATPKKPIQQSIDPGEDDAAESEVPKVDGQAGSPRPPKRPSNYLDEVLADRSRKKHKKSKKRKNQIGVDEKLNSAT